MTDINSSWNDAPSRKVIFEPGVTASNGNVYKTWAEASAALTALAGYPTVLQFVGAAVTIPAGGPYRVQGVPWETDPANPSTVTIAVGVTFDGVFDVGDHLIIDCVATASPVTAPAGFSAMKIGNRATVKSTGAGDTLVDVPNGAIFIPIVGSNATVGDGTAAVFGGASGGLALALMAGQQAEIKNNSFSGPAGFSANAAGNAVGAIVSTTHGSLTDAFAIGTDGDGASVLAIDTSGTTLSTEDFLQAAFDDINTVIEANQTHAGGDGSDHADVATNTSGVSANTATLAKILKGRYTSTAAVNNDVTLTGVTSGDAIVAQINVVGSTPRTILSAEYESADTVRVTFSGDPSTDHEFSLIAYII
jgi:hypothetical protein